MLVTLAAAALAASGALSGLGAGAAWAEAPVQAGWWTQANPGSIEGTPTPPTPPDVPAGGLLVEGGTSSVSGSSDSGPTAFGALVYQVPSGQSTFTLTLAVAPGSATTPSVAVELCGLSALGINAEEGGPMTDAPSFSCSTNVTAQPSSSGDSYRFDVSKLVSAGSLAVAVLPTSPTDRVVLSKPGPTSLPFQVASSGPSSSGSDSGTAGGSAPTSGDSSSGTQVSAGAPAPSADALLPGSSAAVLSSPAEPAPSTPGAAVAGSAPPAPSPGSASTASSSFTAAPDAGGPDTGGAKPLAVGLLIVAFLVGCGIWLAAWRAEARASMRGGPTP